MKSGYAIHPALVFIHIGAGAIGLLSGTAALVFRKGSMPHRVAGNVYYVSMLLMSAIGAYGAYYVPEMVSMIVGVLTFYLVITARMTITRKNKKSGAFEISTMVVAFAAAIAGLVFGLEAMSTETGMKDGFPAGIYFFFGTVALLAGAMDVKMMVRGLSATQRMIRHIWRMCFAMFIATASLFLGQPQVFPESIRGTFILSAPVLLVLLAMIFWLIRARFTARYAKIGR